MARHVVEHMTGLMNALTFGFPYKVAWRAHVHSHSMGRSHAVQPVKKRMGVTLFDVNATKQVQFVLFCVEIDAHGGARGTLRPIFRRSALFV